MLSIVVHARREHAEHCMADRRQRIAKLVRERGQEIVLAPDGVAQRAFELFSLGDVVHGCKPSIDTAARVVRGRVDAAHPARPDTTKRDFFLELDALACEHGGEVPGEHSGTLRAEYLDD